MPRDRSRWVETAQHLQALAEDPGATEHEAANARRALDRLVSEWKITDAELRSDPKTGLSPAQDDLLRRVWDRKSGKIDFGALDALCDQVPDPAARVILKSATAALRVVDVLFLSKRRR